jgi:hypothetical protein
MKSLVFFAALLICTKTPTQNPAAVVTAFYKATSGIVDSGASPTAAELRKIRPCISDEIYKGVTDAVAYREKWGRKYGRNPSDKPPFAQGFWFMSGNEGFRSFKVLGTTMQLDGTSQVNVFFELSSRFTWIDTVVVKKSARDT